MKKSTAELHAAEKHDIRKGDEVIVRLAVQGPAAREIVGKAISTPDGDRSELDIECVPPGATTAKRLQKIPHVSKVNPLSANDPCCPSWRRQAAAPEKAEKGTKGGADRAGASASAAG